MRGDRLRVPGGNPGANLAQETTSSFRQQFRPVTLCYFQIALNHPQEQFPIPYETFNCGSQFSCSVNW